MEDFYSLYNVIYFRINIFIHSHDDAYIAKLIIFGEIEGIQPSNSSSDPRK